MNRSHSVLALIGARMVGSLGGLIAMVILTRLLPKEDFGTYQQVWLVYNTALPFVMLGLPNGITYFVPAATPGRQKAILIHVALLLVGAGFILAVSTYAFSDVISVYFGGPQLAELLRLFSWFPVFSFPLLVLEVFLIATHRAGSAAFVATLSALIQMGAVTAPVALGYSLRVVVTFLCVSALVRVVLFAPLVMRGYRGIAYEWAPKFTGTLLNFTLPLGLASILGSLTLQVGRLFVATRFSTEDYALYDVAARELPFIGIFSGSLMAVVTPDFVRLHGVKNYAEILRVWHSATRKSALLLIPFTILLGVYAEDVVTFLFSDKYAASSQIFSIYLLLLPLRITQHGALLMAAGKTRSILWTHALAVPICVVLCIIFVPAFGLAGAALATVITVYLVAVTLLNLCAVVISVSIRDLLPWAFIGQTVLVSIAAGLGSWLMVSAMAPGFVRLCLFTVAFWACFLAIGCLGFKGLRLEIIETMTSTGLRFFSR